MQLLDLLEKLKNGHCPKMDTLSTFSVQGRTQYTFMDYVKVGMPLLLIMAVVMIFALPLLFPY